MPTSRNQLQLNVSIPKGREDVIKKLTELAESECIAKGALVATLIAAFWDEFHAVQTPMTKLSRQSAKRAKQVLRGARSIRPQK